MKKYFYTEYSDASGMGILDIEKLEYSKELLDKLDIDINLFPKLIKSTDIRGNLKKEFDFNINIVGGAGDQAAGAVGSGVVNPDELSIVLGSSGVVYSPLDKISRNKNVQIIISIEDGMQVAGNMSCAIMKVCGVRSLVAYGGICLNLNQFNNLK